MKVPLIKQKYKLGCGAAALRMTMLYFGVNVSEKNIIEKCGGLKRFGLRTVKLADVASKYGFKTEAYSYNKKMAKGKAEIRIPSTTDIRSFLDKNIPVIIAVEHLALHKNRKEKSGHFIVVAGFKEDRFIYNDSGWGKECGKNEIDPENLMFAWANNVLDSTAYLLAIWK